jgi:hypothetical protein
VPHRRTLGPLVLNGAFPVFKQKIDMVYFPEQTQELALLVYDVDVLGPEKQASIHLREGDSYLTTPGVGGRSR